MRGVDFEVYLGHMGGPFWSRKDAAAWSVIKGAIEAGESSLQAALREFGEETGIAAPAVEYHPLGDFIQPSRKLVTVFAASIDDLPTEITGNTFDLEWPPRSGRVQQFPEIDRGGWFAPEVAREKLVRGLVPVVEALRSHLFDSPLLGDPLHADPLHADPLLDPPFGEL